MPWLEASDARIFYRHEGRGPEAWVFVHGALCDHGDWRHQLDHFAAQGRQVVAPDLGSHGRSSGPVGVRAFARQLQALIEHLQLSRVVLVGHSMGCRVLLQAWKDMPSRVAGLVFVDGAYLVPGLLGDGADRPRLAQEARARAAALYAEVEPAVRARRGFGQMFFDSRFDAERDRMIGRAASLPPQVARELMPDFAAWDVLHMEEVLPTITVPVLAIACTWMDSGHQRRSLSPGVQTPWLQALEHDVPHARVLRWYGGGHFPMIEDPARVNGEIAGFAG